MIAQIIERAGFRRVLYGPSNEPRARQNAREWYDVSNDPQSGAPTSARKGTARLVGSPDDQDRQKDEHELWQPD